MRPKVRVHGIGGPFFRGSAVDLPVDFPLERDQHGIVLGREFANDLDIRHQCAENRIVSIPAEHERLCQHELTIASLLRAGK